MWSMALQYKSIKCSHGIIGKFRIVMGGRNANGLFILVPSLRIFPGVFNLEEATFFSQFENASSHTANNYSQPV